jgi:hypothetical protein
MTTTKRRLSEFGGIASNGGGVEGVLRAALDAIEEGGTLVFDAVRYEGNTSPGFEYAVFSPVVINKSIMIEGDSPDIRLVNKTQDQPTFIVEPNRDFFFFGLENITFVSGATGLLITGSRTLSPNSRIYNVGFVSQSVYSARVTVPETNLHLENVWIKGGQQYGLHFLNDRNHINLSIDKCKIENSSIAGVFYDNFDLNSGSVYISDTELNDNDQALVVNNLRYYEHNVEYFQNNANYVLSGSSARLTGSGGSSGGGGVTDHGLLTGLTDDDHKQYLLINGVRGMSASLNMNGFNILDAGFINGVDLSLVDSTLDNHLLDVDNPHSTKFSNLVPQTLQDLNDVITDADLVSVASFSSFSDYVQAATASFQEFSASTQEFSASTKQITASYLQSSASFDSKFQVLYIFSSSTSSEINILLNSSASFKNQIISLQDFSRSVKIFTASMQSQTASVQTFSASMAAASASYRVELTSQTGSINFLTNASSSTEARFRTFFSSSSSFSSRIDFQTASLVTLQSFSSSHASRHLSGGADPLDVHLLRANGIPANRILISDGIGGWITVLSSTFVDAGGKNYDAFTASIQPTTASLKNATASLQLATASLQTVSASYLNSSASFQSRLNVLTQASSSFAVISSSYISTSASFESEFNSVNSATASLQEATSSLLLTSASFRSELTSLTSSVNLLTNFSSSVEPKFVTLFSSSSSFDSRIATQTISLLALQSSTASLQSATASLNQTTSSLQSTSASYISFSASSLLTSASYRSELNNLNLSSGSLQNFSASVQTTTASLLASSASFSTVSSSYQFVSSSFTIISASFISFSASEVQESASFNSRLNSLQVSSGALQNQTASIQSFTASSLISSASFAATSASYASFSSSFLGTSASFDSKINSIQQTTASLQSFSASQIAISATFNSKLNSLQAFSASIQQATASLQTTTASLIAASSSFAVVSSSYQFVSASYISFSASQLQVSATFNSRLNSLQSTTASLIAASSSYRVELTALTNSVSTLQSFSSSHASRHLSGGLDPIDAQLLRANGIAVNHLLISDGSGGWTTTISNSVGPQPSIINPTQIVSISSSAGTSENYAREDHLHNIETHTRYIAGSDGITEIFSDDDIIEIEADVDVSLILPNVNQYKSFYISKVDYSTNIIELFPSSSFESINDNDPGLSYVLSGSGDPTSKNTWLVYLRTNTNWRVSLITTNLDSLHNFSASLLETSSSFVEISSSYISTSASFVVFSASVAGGGGVTYYQVSKRMIMLGN